MFHFARSTKILFAALAEIHPLLPGIEASPRISNLRLALDTANISKLAFLRHGNTSPSVSGDDFDRVLTDKGRRQARTAGRSYGEKLLPLFSSALISPAPRTMETANIFLAEIGCDEFVDAEPVDALYDGCMQPKGSALFRQLGYAPLRSYLEHQDDQFRQDAVSVLGDYASAAVDAIVDSTASNAPSPEPATSLLVAHAIYLPATALVAASLIGCKDIDAMLDTNTGEAEGYLIDVPSQTVEYLSRD